MVVSGVIEIIVQPLLNAEVFFYQIFFFFFLSPIVFGSRLIKSGKAQFILYLVV